MIISVQNTSPLTSSYFPDYFKTKGINFISFVRTYFQWMEQEYGPRWYLRQIYQIKDIDQTMDQFIVYFKEKYLKNIEFATEANIRTVIKHALDIYRSKGTERCNTLLFQLAFDTTPKFYYPSTDLMRLSDGEWYRPTYLELRVNPDMPISIEQKEVQGATSGAIAFVDAVVRQYQGSLVQDIAYISAVQGLFVGGERIVPTDGSLPTSQSPVLIGSLNNIIFPPTGSGQNYTPGTLLNVTSLNGLGSQVIISNTVDSSGVVTIEFVDGGWGYQISQNYATITYTGNTGVFSNNINVYNYDANGNVSGIGLVISNNSPELEVMILSGDLSSNTIYTFGNAITANVTGYLAISNNPTNFWISNGEMEISNIIFNTTNNEYQNYWNFMETITQPLATLNYVNANGALTNGDYIYTYYGNNTLMGEGLVLGAVQTNTTAGTLVVNILQGDLNNTFYTTSNVIVANLAAVNGYTNSTATGNYIANLDTVTVTLSNTDGYMVGETVVQWGILPTVTSNVATANTEGDVGSNAVSDIVVGGGELIAYPGSALDVPASLVDGINNQMTLQKIGGFGTVSLIQNSNLTITNVSGHFMEGQLFGVASNTVSSIIETTGITIGLVNVHNQFIAGEGSYVYSALMTGEIDTYVDSGSGGTFSFANLSYTSSANVNIDKIEPYANVALEATTYGFPAYPTSNATTGTLNSVLNFDEVTLGKIAKVSLIGNPTDYVLAPFFVIDNPIVSESHMYDVVLQLDHPAFGVGEVVNQGQIVIENGLNGLIVSSNSSPVGNFITVRKYSYTNNFTLTTNSSTVIVSSNSGATANIIAIDYDYFSPVTGRNTTILSSVGEGSNSVANVTVVTSGFGFVNGETITVGSNGAIGTAIVSSQGIGAGYYRSKGGFLSDQKKLFDGYFWQNFSYQIISGLMIDRYAQMVQDITHPAGTIMFGQFLYDTQDNDSLNIQNAVITIS